MTDLTFEDYEAGAVSTAIYPGQGGSLGMSYVGLKMNGEAGEFAEHVGKAFRDDDYGRSVDLTPERRELLKKEVGDVLWYLAAAARELGTSLGEIAQGNLDKLAKRKAEGKLGGSGDTR